MNFWQIIITSSITSGVVSGLVTYFSNKRLDTYQRMMEARKVIYGQINELLSGLYNTAVPDERNKTTKELLKFYRSVQIWGSDGVTRKFAYLLKVLDQTSGASQKVKDMAYKEFIIAMRADLLGKTRFKPEDIFVLGKIS